MARVLIRAPDHLGDGVQALPAIAALAALHEVSIEGPDWAPAVYGHTGARFGPLPAADVAVLFKPSFSAAWKARRVPRRVGLATDGRSWLLHAAIRPLGGHRSADYARIAAAAGAMAVGHPSLPADSARPAPGLPPHAVLLLAGTRSAATVRWRHFRALAAAIGERAVWVAGPGDEQDVLDLAGSGVVGPVDVATLAALAIAAEAVVGCDSGLTHVAAAARRGAGLDPAAVHVVYGSTSPTHTGPPGTTSHMGTRPSCWPCYAKSCSVGTPCLDTPVETVLRAIGG